MKCTICCKIIGVPKIERKKCGEKQPGLYKLKNRSQWLLL
jgi:hypothetical protein